MQGYKTSERKLAGIQLTVENGKVQYLAVREAAHSNLSSNIKQAKRAIGTNVPSRVVPSCVRDEQMTLTMIKKLGRLKTEREKQMGGN